MTMATRSLRDEDDTRALARSLAAALQPGDLVIVEGPLGAGKTLFASATAHALGVPEDEPVTSPTFALAQEYEGRLPLVHADLYRLGGPGEVFELGFDERREEGAVALVEWGERFREALLPDLLLRLAITGDTSREATLEAASARGAALLRATLEGMETTPR